MSRIPQSFLDDLLERVDIVDIIDKRVKLKRSGKNYSACCPFHDEKTPSFTVSPDKQFYYCFGCGASGTAINFLMEYDRSDFVQTVESLAKTAGVQVPREQRKYDDGKEKRRRECYSILEEANGHFQNQLKDHPQKQHAISYLQDRGLSGQIAKAYNLGYSPPGWDNLLLQLGTNESRQRLLIDTGLVIEKPDENKRYDRFRHRIMFPIRDSRGRTIGFGGRVLGDDKPKYLNSPETDVFHKARELYGLYEAKKHIRQLESLIVVEGYMDVIALAQYGMWNTVATLGTACGEEHLKLAFKHVKEVVFCFDGDKAGRTAARRALLSSLGAMEDGRQIRFLFLSEGQDPDSLVRQIGAERFQEQISKALPLEDFLFDVAADGIDLNSMDGRARFSKNAAPLIQQLPEGIFRSLMMENLAKRTGLSLEILSEFTQVPEELKPEEATSEPSDNTNTESAPNSRNGNTQQRIHAPSDNNTTPYGDPAAYPEASAADENARYLDDYTQAAHYDQAANHALDAIRAESAAAVTPPLFRPQPQTSQLSVSPARNAIILLLEHPQLLQNCPIELELSDTMKETAELHNLDELVRYLRKRPDANFNNIMGFWGGAKGVEAQQKLAQLAANQIFGELKTIETYDAAKELDACLNSINSEAKRQKNKAELATLTHKGLGNLNNDEKKRYIELIKLA